MPFWPLTQLQGFWPYRPSMLQGRLVPVPLATALLIRPTQWRWSSAKRKNGPKWDPTENTGKTVKIYVVLLYLKLRVSKVLKMDAFFQSFLSFLGLLASWQVRTCYFQGWIYGFHKKFREVDLLWFTTSSWAQSKISYKPWECDFWNLQDSIVFANANPVTPKNIWRTPPIIAGVGFLALIWKRSGNWEARKSQIEIVSLSGFHQANLRHTHLGDPHVPSKYSRKHHRDYPPANGGKPLEARFELISWRSSGNPTLRSMLSICGWFYQLKKKNSAIFAYTIPLDPKNPWKTKV